MSTTFQREPSILHKLLFFCCCLSLGLSRGAAPHLKCVYSRPAHCSPSVQSQSLQAGRLALLLTATAEKKFRITNKSPAEDTEEFFRHYTKANWKKVYNYASWLTHKALLKLLAFLSSLHPKIFLFVVGCCFFFFLAFFSSSHKLFSWPFE